MMEGFKTITVDIPDPAFPAIETLRESAIRRFIQRKIFARLSDKESVFRRLLSQFHGAELVDVIEHLMDKEGLDSETAEALLHKIVDEFVRHSPLAMFLHYLEADDFEKAAAHYTFAPMQVRFLEISTITEGLEVRAKCAKSRFIIDEFDFLCEELGLSYRSDSKTWIVPNDQVIDALTTDLMRGALPRPRHSHPVSIKDILKGCKECGD